MSVEETAGGPPAPRFLGSQMQMVLSQRSQAQQREMGTSRVGVQGNAFGEREANLPSGGSERFQLFRFPRGQVLFLDDPDVIPMHLSVE